MGNAVQGNAPSVITLDLLRVALRWVHLTAAVMWIGGTFFYLFVIRPSVDTAERAAGWKKISQEVEGRFHEVVQLCIWTFLHLRRYSHVRPADVCESGPWTT